MGPWTYGAGPDYLSRVGGFKRGRKGAAADDLMPGEGDYFEEEMAGLDPDNPAHAQRLHELLSHAMTGKQITRAEREALTMLRIKHGANKERLAYAVKAREDIERRRTALEKQIETLNGHVQKYEAERGKGGIDPGRKAEIEKETARLNTQIAGLEQDQQKLYGDYEHAMGQEQLATHMAFHNLTEADVREDLLGSARKEGATKEQIARIQEQADQWGLRLNVAKERLSNPRAYDQIDRSASGDQGGRRGAPGERPVSIGKSDKATGPELQAGTATVKNPFNEPKPKPAEPPRSWGESADYYGGRAADVAGHTARSLTPGMAPGMMLDLDPETNPWVKYYYDKNRPSMPEQMRSALAEDRADMADMHKRIPLHSAKDLLNWRTWTVPFREWNHLFNLGTMEQPKILGEHAAAGTEAVTGSKKLGDVAGYAGAAAGMGPWLLEEPGALAARAGRAAPEAAGVARPMLSPPERFAPEGPRYQFRPDGPSSPAPSPQQALPAPPPAQTPPALLPPPRPGGAYWPGHSGPPIVPPRDFERPSQPSQPSPSPVPPFPPSAPPGGQPPLPSGRTAAPEAELNLGPMGTKKPALGKMKPKPKPKRKTKRKDDE